MPSEKIQEALSHLQDDWLIRVLQLHEKKPKGQPLQACSYRFDVFTLLCYYSNPWQGLMR